MGRTDPTTKPSIGITHDTNCSASHEEAIVNHQDGPKIAENQFTPPSDSVHAPLNMTDIDTQLSSTHTLTERVVAESSECEAKASSSFVNEHDYTYVDENDQTQSTKHIPIDQSRNRFPDADDLTVAIGQLSVDEENYVSYYGRSSGLHLLASVVEQVDLREKAWSGNSLPRVGISNPLNCLPEGTYFPEYISPTDYVSGLPNLREQEYMLQIYFIHVHPHLPILHAKDIMTSFRNVSVAFHLTVQALI